MLQMQTQQIAQASTIEVPTYDPPYTSWQEGANLNGSKTVDYNPPENENIPATVFVAYFNNTVEVDVSEYNDCLAGVGAKIAGGVQELTKLTNDLAESERVIALPPDEQKVYAYDHYVLVQYIFSPFG